MEESQDFKPDRGNPAVRHYRGASENVTLVEMCSHLATERAGMGTLHLTVGASELYPNPNGNGEQWIGRTYGATAPVLIVGPETKLCIRIEEVLEVHSSGVSAGLVTAQNIC